METTRIQRLFDEADERRYLSGVEQGIKLGIEQAKKQYKIQVATKMLATLDDATIVSFTDLTLPEVQALRKQQHS